MVWECLSRWHHTTPLPPKQLDGLERAGIEPGDRTAQVRSRTIERPSVLSITRNGKMTRVERKNASTTLEDVVLAMV
jgi:hypothetical protein